jgi:hypothetical protein
MAKESKGLLNWRKHQKKGAIMKPSTFKGIVSKNTGKFGKKVATEIAGKAYWNSAKAKYSKKK